MDALNTPLPSPSQATAGAGASTEDDDMASPLVSTFFEGELIDLQHHDFSHRHWRKIRAFAELIQPTLTAAAAAEADSRPASTPVAPTSRISGVKDKAESSGLPPAPSSAGLLLPPSPPPPPPPPASAAPAAAVGGVAPSLCSVLRSCRFVFMRWKERYFLCGEGGCLSISGVYFLAMDRVTGDIGGFYVDRRKKHRSFQELRLARAHDGSDDGRVSAQHQQQHHHTALA